MIGEGEEEAGGGMGMGVLVVGGVGRVGSVGFEDGAG